ncbi:MAG: hypothetical protein AABM32_00010 [Chloroflexota bacterium]
MNGNLVRYVCRAKAHVDASRNATVAAGSPVTVHEGEWAYCAAGAHTEHVWEEIELVTLTNLKLMSASNLVHNPTPPSRPARAS